MLATAASPSKIIPEISIEGYEEIMLPLGVIYSNLVEKRVEIVVKKRSDGEVSIYTDKSEESRKFSKSAKLLM